MAVISPPSSPPPSPACRPSPLARHHITAETAALSPTPPQRPRHRPNRGRYSHRHLNCHHPNHRRHPSRRHHPHYGRLTAATPVTAAQPSLPQPPPRSRRRRRCTHCSLAPCITWPPTCSTTPPTLVLVPCIYLNAKYIIIFYA